MTTTFRTNQKPTSKQFVHNVLFTWMTLVSFQLNFISQDLVIKGAQHALDSSKQPGNLSWGRG